MKGGRARPRKWAQQVVAGRAGMRRDDESVTHGVAPRMLILPPQTLPPLFTWMSHIPSPHISYHSVLSILSLSSRLDQPFDNLFDLLSRGEESRGRREHVDRYGSRDIRVDGSDFRGTTFRRNERNNTNNTHRVLHVTSRFRVKISFIRFLFLFFLLLNPSSGLSDPMIHGNSNSSRPASFTGSISSENREPISSSFSFYVLLTEIQIQDLFQTSVRGKGEL